jgi:hypothetical protein
LTRTFASVAIIIYLYNCSVPNACKETQCAYLVDVLTGMRDQDRADFCMRDDNVRELLLSQCFNKMRDASSSKNVRSLANLICRFMEPLLSKMNMKSTAQLLVYEHSREIFDALVSFGGIESFLDNPQTFIDALQTSAVSSELFLNATS